MSGSERVIAYVDEQLAGMRRYPLMWGPPIAVELGYLQLLETRFVALRPDLDAEQPRLIKDRYQEFLRKRFPQVGVSYLCSIFDVDRIGDLVSALRDFEEGLQEIIAAKSLFETSPLAMALQLREGVARPSSTTFTAYLEAFRRVLRATLRGPSKTGRSTKDVELLTNFELPAVEVREANGSPSRVTYPLFQRHSEQGVLIGDPEAAVKEVVAQLVTVIDWADRGGVVADLGGAISDPDRRRTIAAQALRLVPRGEVERVELGGTLVSRPAPVILRAKSKAKLAEVFTENRRVDAFDHEGEIRALDLDQASFRLRATSGTNHRCWLQEDPFELLSEWELGAQVRVRGRQIFGVFQKPLVIVDQIQLLSEPSTDTEDP